MKTINVKEIEELSDSLHEWATVSDLSGPKCEVQANALDALLAFYKESVEQEPVGYCDYGDRVEWYGNRPANETNLYALPPASAARIAELEQQVVNLQKDKLFFVKYEQATREKLRIARDAFNTVEINSEECLDFDECTAMLVPLDDYNRLSEALAALGEEL